MLFIASPSIIQEVKTEQKEESDCLDIENEFKADWSALPGFTVYLHQLIPGEFCMGIIACRLPLRRS